MPPAAATDLSASTNALTSTYEALNADAANLTRPRVDTSHGSVEGDEQ